MFVKASAPRTIGGVLDDAIGLYRQALPRVWPLTLASALATGIPGIVFGLQIVNAGQDGALWMLRAVKSPSIWLVYVLLTLSYLLLQGALVSALNAAATRDDVSLGDALGVGCSLLGRLFVVSLLLSLIVGVGLLLFIIPGVYLAGIYQLTVVALVVERTTIMQSFSVSAGLIKGYWWRSGMIVSVAIIIILIFSLIGGVVNAVAARLFGAGGWGLVIGQGFAMAVNVALIPLLPCSLLAMYYDLKLRHEGGDLADRVAAIAGG